MPEDFWSGADVWTRVVMAGNTSRADRPASLVVWARLLDGITAEHAGQELTGMAMASKQSAAAITYEPFHPAEGRDLPPENESES